jgi:hypothetical protein
MDSALLTAIFMYALALGLIALVGVLVFGSPRHR